MVDVGVSTTVAQDSGKEEIEGTGGRPDGGSRRAHDLVNSDGFCDPAGLGIETN